MDDGRDGQDASVRHQLGERVKELTLLHAVAALLQPRRGVDQSLFDELAAMMPPAWQFPEICAARIECGGIESRTTGWRETPWRQSARFQMAHGSPGVIEVVYLEPRPDAAEGPFLAEERNLINSMAAIVASHIERSRGEADLRERESHCREIFEQVPIAIALVDPAGQFLRVNPAFQALLGFSDTELVRMRLAQLVHPADLVSDVELLHSTTIGGRSHRQTQKRLVRKDGELAFGRITVAWIEDDCLQPLRAVVAIEDRAEENRSERERIRLDAQVRQMQKLGFIGSLTSGVAHDFNNVLSVVIANSHLLLEHPVSALQSELVGEIRDAAERAAGLTRQLLSFTQNTTPSEPADIDPARLLDGLQAFLRRVVTVRVELSIDAAPDVGLVRADVGQLEQVLINLAINARDAMPDGGQLIIRAENVGAQVMFSVSDSGHGIDAETLRRIFEPYFTTKEPGRGTGIGLSVTSDLVQRMGGTLAVRSEVGRGTTFSIHLPRLPRAGDDPHQP